MLYAICIINSLAVFLIYHAVFSFIKVPAVVNKIGQLHSYKPKFKLKDVLINRYIKQTFLKETITFREMTLYYLLWCVGGCLLIYAIKIQGMLFWGAVVAIVLSPILIMENYILSIDLSIDKGLFNLLTQINGQLVKTEDILKALQESQNKIDNVYITKILVEFNQYIKFGIAPPLAFSRIQSVVKNEYLKYLFLNIEIVYMRRGNVVELMKALEQEFTSIQIEINKRKVELSHERKMTAFSLLLLGLTTLKIVRDNDYILTYYKVHMDIAFFLVIFVGIGIGFVVKANMTKY